MKKRLVIAALASLSFSQVAMADQDAGCGIGSMIFAGQSGKVFKVLAATTNGIFGNQTIGITFGTLGCNGNGPVTSSQRLVLFIDGNMDNLARDIAKGEGETLATLAEVWGIEDADKAAFNQFTQDNFAQVFQSEFVTSQDVLSNLNNLIAHHNVLATYSL
ncbi:MAG: DUF3015 domain-containing protein [Ferrimonas sp.]